MLLWAYCQTNNLLYLILQVQKKYDFRTINHPLPPQFLVHSLYGEEFILTICFNIGLLLFLCIFMTGPSQERVNGSKHLQGLCGANMSSFWVSHFLFDAFLSVFVNVDIILLLFLSEVEFLADQKSYLHTLLALNVYCWAVVPLVYLASFFCDSPTSGLAKTIIINLLLGQFLHSYSTYLAFNFGNATVTIWAEMRIIWRADSDVCDCCIDGAVVWGWSKSFERLRESNVWASGRLCPSFRLLQISYAVLLKSRNGRSMP